MTKRVVVRALTSGKQHIADVEPSQINNYRLWSTEFQGVSGDEVAPLCRAKLKGVLVIMEAKATSNCSTCRRFAQ